MESKKFVAVMLASLLLTFAVVPAAMATVDVSNATIIRTGYNPAFVGAMVQLKDNAATPKWTGMRTFYLSPSLGNQGLAVLLTAVSMGKTVWVRIAGDAASGSLIEVIFINN